jgi:tRNA(Ile)-lysidine synthase TilS/MesJ
MRRGALNNKAIELGFNKLALGHHADDVVQTMLLSLLYEGRFSTFQPVSFMDRSGITLIRPFIYTSESDVKGAVNKLNLPVLHNPCPANKHTQREYVNELVKRLTKEVPYARERMLGAIYHPERANLWQKPDKSDD